MHTHHMTQWSVLTLTSTRYYHMIQWSVQYYHMTQWSVLTLTSTHSAGCLETLLYCT